MTTFVNEKRKCGCTTEGFGEHATRWWDFEVKCGECGCWTKEYGDVSVQVGDDPNVQAWLCPGCSMAALAEPTADANPHGDPMPEYIPPPEYPAYIPKSHHRNEGNLPGASAGL